jgi:hypothetical protein
MISRAAHRPKLTIKNLDPALRGELIRIYEEVMWLARRRNVSASCARAWYTHVRSGKVTRRLRRFTGKVSRSAAGARTVNLRLEHYKRIQTTLTALVMRHRKIKKPDPGDFIRVLLNCERVHIVTFGENYAVRRSGGNYRKAGVELLPWRALPPERQAVLWKRMLRGRVANADAYVPKHSGAASRIDS